MFDRTSFDLIYARPDQTPALWRAELSEALTRAAEHLSLYQLTIEPGTPFHGLAAAGKLVTPDDETGRVLYDVTQEVCGQAGLPAYEISNHARPGAESRHNCSTGATANMPASARARMAGWSPRRAGSAPSPSAARRPGLPGSSATDTASSRPRRCRPRTRPTSSS